MKRVPSFLRAVSDARGFSLVEVVISMGIAAVALVSIMGMLPYAMEASRDSADETAIATVLEDLHERLKGNSLEPGAPTDSPFFYDQQGMYSPARDTEAVSEAAGGGPFFRVDVEFNEPAAGASFENANGLLAAVVEVSWPVDAEGEPVGTGNPKTGITYYLTTLTGTDWEKVDPEYQPKIEY